MKIKRINWKKVLVFSIWAVVGIGLLVALGFVNHIQQELKCKSISINFDADVHHDFIDEQEISELIKSKEKLIGKPLGSINTTLLEKIIMSIPFVQKAEVYSSVDGNINVSVTQRNPLVRIITMHDEQFYIDNKGGFMPVSNKYSTPVLVASGHIYNRFTQQKTYTVAANVSDTASQIKPVIEQVYELAMFIEADTFWNAQAEQIYVNESQELELIPRIGNHRIIIGDAENLDEKFNRLMIFYTKGLNKTGWNNYNIINLKYRNQVVCTKIKS